MFIRLPNRNSPVFPSLDDIYCIFCKMLPLPLQSSKRPPQSTPHSLADDAEAINIKTPSMSDVVAAAASGHVDLLPPLREMV